MASYEDWFRHAPDLAWVLVGIWRLELRSGRSWRYDHRVMNIIPLNDLVRAGLLLQLPDGWYRVNPADPRLAAGLSRLAAQEDYQSFFCRQPWHAEFLLRALAWQRESSPAVGTIRTFDFRSAPLLGLARYARASNTDRKRYSAGSTKGSLQSWVR